MNILEICTGSGLGGLELYFLNCVRWFNKTDHNVIALTAAKTKLTEKLTDEELQYIAIKDPGKIFPLESALKVAKIINQNSIDTVHVHHKKDLALVALAKTFCQHRFKVVHTRQMEMPHSKKDPYHQYIYSSIDLYIAITEQLKKESTERLPISPEKIILLYYGVKAPSKTDKSICSELIKSSNKPFLIGLFSRIDEQKGQHLIIEAAKTIMEKYGENIHYFIIGNVMDEAYMKQLQETITQYGLNKVFHFKNFHPDPMEIMPCFDIIVMPSKKETFGLVLVEAMRSKVAVISTNAGGVPEIIDDNVTGLLFEWGDSNQLAQKIEALYTNPALKDRLASAGKEKADKLFDAETHFNKLEELLLALHN